MPAIDTNSTRPANLPQPKKKVARKRKTPAASPPPVTDVQSSGGNYGLPKAKKYARKHRTQVKSDVQASGGDYGLPKAKRAVVKSYAKQTGLTKGGSSAQARYDYAVAQARKKGVDVSALPADLVPGLIDRLVPNARERALAKVSAPGVKFLGYVGRPGRAATASIDAALTGKNIGHAASEAILRGKGALGSDVLKHLGVHNKTLRAIGGGGLDIVADPTTYTTFGVGGVAKGIVAKEAERVTAKALKAGMTKDLAERLGQRAGARAAAKAPANKGIQIGLRAHVPFTNAGFNVKTSGRATAAIARKTGITKAGQRVRETGVAQTLGRGLVHDFRPTGVTTAQHETVRSALAQHRAQSNAGELAAHRAAHAAAKTVKTPQEASHIIDLIEAGKAHTHPVAAAIAADLNTNTRQLAKRGLTRPFHSTGPQDAASYFPHLRRQDLEAIDKAQPKAIKAGSTVVKASKGRKIRKSLNVIRGDATQPFSEDVAAVVGAHLTKSARAKALSDLWQKVAAAGKEVKPGKDLHVNDLGEELVYKVTPHGLEPLVKEGGDKIDLAAIQKVLNGQANGRHVVLPKHLVEDVKGRLAHVAQGDRGPFRYFDQATGKWKTATTVLNPSYHGRNLLGDTQNAMLAGTRVRDFRQSGKALRALSARNRVEASPERFAPGNLTAKAQKLADRPVKLGKSGNTTVGNLVKEAESHGAIRTGFVGGEVTQLAGAKGEAGFILRRLGKTSRPSPIRTANEYREDYPRLATYISARKRGMTPEQATAHVATHHFDYADLTPFERQSLRRIFPFYTFFARNTRLQVTKLLQEPGKYAALSHVLDETAHAAGFADYQDFASKLPDSQQRGIPIPIKVGGQVLNLYAGFPTTDLNQLTIQPGDWAKNLANRATPLKAVLEVYLNYSVFFQGQIQDPKKPRVPAPSIVGSLPEPIKQRLGVAKILDKKTGKLVWGWNAKADYIARLLPQTNLGVGLSTPTAGSRGMTPPLVALSQSGVRVAPANLGNQEINVAQQNLIKTQDRLNALRQQGIGVVKPYTAEYRKLLLEARIYSREVLMLKAQRGDKILPGRKRVVSKAPSRTVVAPAAAAAPPASSAPPPPASP